MKAAWRIFLILIAIWVLCGAATLLGVGVWIVWQIASVAT